MVAKTLPLLTIPQCGGFIEKLQPKLYGKELYFNLNDKKKTSFNLC